MVKIAARWQLLALVVFLSALVMSCSDVPRAGRLSEAIEQKVREGPGTEIQMASLTTFQWDTLYFFGPYTNASHLTSALHLTSERQARQLLRGMDGRDDVTLLVFRIPGDKWISMTHSRAAGDFGPELHGRAYAPSQTRFRVRIPPAELGGDIGPSEEGGAPLRSKNLSNDEA